MFKIINERMCKVWLSLDIVFKLSSLYEVAKNHCFERKGTLSDYIMKVNEIDYQGGKNEINQTSSIIGDLLYKIRDRVEYEEIKSEIDTMLIAVSKNYFGGCIRIKFSKDSFQHSLPNILKELRKIIIY